MTIYNVLNLFGGLALFLFGMQVMGEGLTKTAGSKLEYILEQLSNTRFKGLLLGIGVTAIIQSSSATTVMVVGFVNAGIMKLSQAVGIIMGANIGTTVTAWILSLTGLSSSSPIVAIFMPKTFVPVLAVIGIIFYAFTKSDAKKDIGIILLGFSVLMYGMEGMSSAVSPLADDPRFTNFMIKFSNPFLGLLMGLVVTAIIQSSSASVGILQALCVTGVVPYSVVIPIILGQNIGTCITAVISSIGGKVNAKRAAMIHVYLNVIGAFLFMAIFYLLNAFIHFGFLSNAASTVGIAIIHSAFNIFVVAVLFPFGDKIVQLATVTIRDKAEEEEEVVEKNESDVLSLLDDRFLERPAFAVGQCETVAHEMANLTNESLTRATSLLLSYDKKIYKEVIADETEIDTFEDVIGSYLVKVSSKSLSAEDSKKISIILHCMSDFERISDHARNLAESSQKLSQKGLYFSDKAVDELSVYISAINEIVSMSKDLFINKDVDLAKKVEPLEEVIDNINEKARKHHFKRLQKGKCTLECGMVYEDILTDLERISDHCSNIAVCLIEIKNNTYDTHEYIDSLKESQTDEFRKLCSEYDKKFHI